MYYPSGTKGPEREADKLLVVFFGNSGLIVIKSFRKRLLP